MSIHRASHRDHGDDLNETLRQHAKNVAGALSNATSTSSPSPDFGYQRPKTNRWPDLVEGHRQMIITERGGILFVEEDGGVFWDGSTGLGRARSRGLGGEIICRLQFDNLHSASPEDQRDVDAHNHDPATDLLMRADRLLMGVNQPGLRQWDHEECELRDAAKPVENGRILLLIPGMFVNGAMLTTQISNASDDFLKRVASHYDQFLVLDYLTLSDSPLLTAVKLAGLFRDSHADIDILCHGRGSLIARWWLQELNYNDFSQRQTMLIGPDMDDRLFSPDRLHAALNLLTNIARVQPAKETSSALLTIAMSIFVMVSSVSSLNARGPIIKSALASIPGIAPPGGNLAHLETCGGKPFDVCAAITSDFAPRGPDDSYWPFWHYFLDRHFEFENSDSLSAFVEPIFDLENDLLALGKKDIEGLRIDDDQHKHFNPEDRVHHFNYFDQLLTYEMIVEAFGIKF